MTRSKKSKTQSSSSRAASSKSSLSYLKEETTQENLSLGDFGGLWLFLQGEKAKWCNSNIPAPLDIESILNVQSIESETKQPPQLPHSSSSEYSSEEEIVVAESKVHKAVQQSSKKKVEGIVTVSKGKGSPNKKKGKKTATTNESKADVAVGTLIDGVKKVHFNESIQVNSRSSVPIPITISDDPIHVFIDNSNILVGFLAYCRQHAKRPKGLSGQRSKPTLDYNALFTILERERNIARRVLVASSPLYQPLEKADQAGYEVSVLKRVKSDSNSTQTDFNDYQSPFEMEKEQCVDELLHLKILESLLDYHAPATLVLASGDGKDAEYFEGGFHKCVIKALERGWKVEIISWKRQLSQNFLNKKFLSKWEGLYHVVFLDWFAAELGCHM
ncbi:hypothetical protein RhiirA1_413604 [Rhizophagus irregularis]|uniref:NYN domain-containing protein n=2 Tax=Rhizophagus irregularis TaxID=588596 RepID=A0A2N0S6B5_9GLOM|nr:hypothetical protein RirG_047960 [Rhizophagus irregularis DAOM 197198w]PKC71091.1 hypothetical protein RhiirA1_413604 [Rhizophagus irregularis]GBC13322.1 hypothetical protein GLOIN_2v1654888 [Rhizophagus irregularis DAOM 181602=DAOM 197198]UZO19269.1 hypothetical protein OCT59_010567 [Rhizophagus irregularis]CAB4374903.1 unnamed protein product [Rhizophagus irregularis]